MTDGWDEAVHGPPLDGVRWAREAASAEHLRLLAPEGAGAWRHMAWPVADAVFELNGAGPGTGVLVAGGSAEERAAVAAGLEGSPWAVHVAERLTLDAIRACAVVVLLGGREALPAPAFVPLAAGRVLVAPRRARMFGLHPGIDMVAGAGEAELVEAAATVLRHVDAFEMTRVLGALAAERQRASTINARLAVDLELG